MTNTLTSIPAERILKTIYLVRGQKVMLDRDLARLYGVETRALNQAVRRNVERFPEDFMFPLTREEIRDLSQIVISSGIKHAPRILAFTEHGVAMDPPAPRQRRMGFHVREPIVRYGRSRRV